MNEIEICGRKIGEDYPPLVIAEIGINHEGQVDKAVHMIEAAAFVGCECVKFQTHIIEDEMIPNDLVPGNANESIWDIMCRCALTEEEEKELKALAESKGMIFLSTPFSRAAANRLENMGVAAFKIGSGECNNYPLITHIAQFGKPIILSTGMNNLKSIALAVKILRNHNIPFAILHCTSIYPTPYNKVRLKALNELKQFFPDSIIGLSDHSLGNYPCFAAVSFGASILERHFTCDKSWQGPDIEISMDPSELKDLIIGSRAIHQALDGHKDILPEEQTTINFAYASIVTIKPVKKGEILSLKNIWVKRPGTGSILADQFDKVLSKRFTRDLSANCQISLNDIESF